MALPATGRLPLLNADRRHNRSDLVVTVVRVLDDLPKVYILRALTYLAEQECPYEEEFDSNDLCALHLLALEDGQPAASLRIRFFSDFCTLDIPAPQHPEAITFDSDPFAVLRPEGAWDEPGVLDPKPGAVAAPHAPQPVHKPSRVAQEMRARPS